MPRTALRRYLRHGLLPQLIVFESVVRLGSVTRAAEALHIAQPTASIQLKKLAETFGLALLEQRGRQLHLTAAGRELLAACQELLELLLRAETRLAGLRAGSGGSLRIAAVDEARRLAARLLASFCSRHPGVQASLYVGNGADLMQRLAAREDHLYIVGLPDHPSGMAAYPFAAQALRLYCEPSHPLSRAPAVSLARLAGEGFVVREAGCAARSMLEALLAQAGGELRIRAELGSDEALAEAASKGLGVALLPTEVAASFVSAGSLAIVDAEIPDLERNWQLVHPKRAALPAAASLFLGEVLAEHAAMAQAGASSDAASARSREHRGARDAAGAG